ncbi:PREDICTED: E3 ubiquitin-protein ligase pellino homolog 2 [Ceratotherium simum simum]|uniref:E3 ubiquitin-protein ligase pellino homolog 2 n=1 Tax=Ceratotherium simum simum TaxID=73337 RepID=A0ABM0HGC7_CERSS|nr:PREDICTED: E3 ubiquitin-protein ligase pellino homolog 2 [Ceratotherium simum simum]
MTTDREHVVWFPNSGCGDDNAKSSPLDPWGWLDPYTTVLFPQLCGDGFIELLFSFKLLKCKTNPKAFVLTFDVLGRLRSLCLLGHHALLDVTGQVAKARLLGEERTTRYNGALPNGDRGRRKSRFALYKRPKANGVKPSMVHVISTPQASKAISCKGQHSISYTLSRNQTVVVEYTHDKDTDMFQVGRSTESPIDFVVTDTISGGQNNDEAQITQSTISRFACRIVCDRNEPYTARIFAAGFDSSKNIFLGEKAAKWKNPDGHMDGLTTNGVLVMHPRGGFTEESQPGVWREISVCGDVYTLRETRSAQQRGKLVESETNVLQDGSLIDLCGATLLWRTADGLFQAPTQKHIEALRQEINAARPQCPVGLNTLAFPSISRKEVVEEKQPWAYLSCGHVHGHHNWGHRSDTEANERECPMCRTVGPYVPLWLGCEAGFYVDAGPPTHAFTPCGHVCSEKSAKYWSQIPLPHGTHAFHAACPFCATQLAGEQNCIKLIFQGPVD